MDKLGLLNSETSDGDQVLETDIMRFLAVIGIVFWIIFSVVKSIPFQTETTAAAGAVQTNPQKAEKAVDVKNTKLAESNPKAGQGKSRQKTPAEAHRESSPEISPQNLSADMAAKNQPRAPSQVKSSPEPTTHKAKEQQKIPKETDPSGQAPTRKGIRLEFQSLEAIQQLMRDQQLDVYGRAQATGFDLIFQGSVAGDTVHFQSARNIPRQMWEIRRGQAQRFFLEQMAGAYPAIRTFPQKSVQVAFLDKKLENRLVKKMRNLRRQGQNGILTVTSQGTLIFTTQKQEKEDAKTKF